MFLFFLCFRRFFLPCACSAEVSARAAGAGDDAGAEVIDDEADDGTVGLAGPGDTTVAGPGDLDAGCGPEGFDELGTTTFAAEPDGNIG